MEYPLFSIIVLNWNGRSYLRECLQSLSDLKYNPLEIIVVDNASTDASFDIVNQFSNVKLIRNSINAGYAEGNNIAIRTAKGKYAITLNNDLTVAPDFLNKVVEILENDRRIGIIACRQMSYFDHKCIDGLYSYPTRAMIFSRMGHGKKYTQDRLYNSCGFVIGAIGASSIYRMEMLNEIGMFDSRFFAFHEESDLSMRAFLRNWKCVYVPSAVVYHMGTESFNKRKKMFYYHRERNRIWFIYKNFPLYLLFKWAPVLILREIKTFIKVCLIECLPAIYFRAKWDGFTKLALFRSDHALNSKLFINRKHEFYKLMKHKLLVYEKPDSTV